MVGQQNLIKQIDWMISANCFPRFSIFTGERGSEMNSFPPYIADCMKANHVFASDNKIDTVRELIKQAYKIHDITVFSIRDVDDMSIPAKNALLKVTEEPPNNAYFILTMEDANNTLDTIRSRATLFTLEKYKPSEITEYAQATYQDNIELYRELCATPGEVDLLYKMGAEDFYYYVEKVVENIATVNGANSFKIAEKLALKDEEDKYDLKLFWKTFIRVCSKRGSFRDYFGIAITSDALKQLRIRGVNKQMLFDEWLLEIRSSWMEGR